jgi:hypothetical protein
MNDMHFYAASQEQKEPEAVERCFIAPNSVRKGVVDRPASVLIRGCGRSGTSMVASLFEECGLFESQTLYEPTSGNPLGFFESLELNECNNDIIDAMLCWPLFDWKIRRRISIAAHAERRAYWLAAPARIANVRLAPQLKAKMARLVEQAPFCLKDPRFSVTLPYWREMLPPETRFVVVYRDPALTAASILKFAAEQYDPPIQVTIAWAFTLWSRSYSRLLSQFADSERSAFVSYDDMTSGEGVSTIEHLTGYTLPQERIRPETRRTLISPRLAGMVPRECRSLYERLRIRSQQDYQNLVGGESLRHRTDQ